MSIPKQKLVSSALLSDIIAASIAGDRLKAEAQS